MVTVGLYYGCFDSDASGSTGCVCNADPAGCEGTLLPAQDQCLNLGAHGPVTVPASLEACGSTVVI